jgi:predicted ATPase
MLTKLKTINYRGFKEIDIPLSKLNIFLGPNNSGKSNILSALNLLSQTLSSGYDEIPLLINGDRIKLGTYKDIVFNNEVKQKIVFELNYKYEFEKTFAHSEEYFDKIDWSDIGFKFTFSYLELDRLISIDSIIAKDKSNNVLFNVQRNKNDYELSKAFDITVGSEPINLINFLPDPDSIDYLLRLTHEHCDPYSSIDQTYFIYHPLKCLSDNFLTYLKNIDFIGPLREFPERTYFFSGISPRIVGSKGQNLPQILSMKKEILENINNLGKQAGLFNEIFIENPTDRLFEIKIKNYYSEEIQNWADVGFGISQFLPIVIACYNSSSSNGRSGLIIEQPELHLHPRAQAELGSMFCNLIAKSQNSQFFVETHSEHLVVRTQYEIAKGTISSDDVKIFYVYTENSEKIIKQIQINPDGTFADEWPEGFFPEGYEEAKKFAKAVRERKHTDG